MLSTCDKRRSRAARSILINATLPILEQHDPYRNAVGSQSQSQSQSQSPQEKMDSYKSLISMLITSPDTCILHPKLDILWKEEQTYTTVKARTNKRLTLHKCGECGKTFLSRYYLDLHMKNHHDGENEIDVSSTHSSNHEHDHDHHHGHKGLLCPADQWCTLLGGNICDRRAIQDEPFYAPGIHHERYPTHESLSIEREYKRQTHSHPCNETELEISREFCISSITDCFAGNEELVDQIVAAICHTQTCRHRLLPSSWMIPHYDLRDEWDMHHDEINRVGFLFGTSTLVFLVWILLWKCWDWDGYGVIPSVHQLWMRLIGRDKRRKTRFDLSKRKKLS